jgi:hypothetical protein
MEAIALMPADPTPRDVAPGSQEPGELSPDQEDFARLLGRLVARRWLATQRIAISPALPDDEVPAGTKARSHPDPTSHDAI